MVATRTHRPPSVRRNTGNGSGGVLFGATAMMVVLLGGGGPLISGLSNAANVAGTSGSASEPPSAETAAGIPGNYLQAYQSAGNTCSGLDWATIAAVGQVETHHGRLNAKGVSSGENYAGAGGPMQFLSSSYKSIQNKHPDITGSRYDPESAVKASAHKLCDDGAADGNVSKAIYAYNHSSEYVSQVQQQAAAYRSGSASSS